MRWHKDRAVDCQEAASDSVLAFYRALLTLRREHRWAEGALTRVRHEGDLLVMELRRDDGSRYKGLFNFGKTSCSADLVGQPLIASAADQAPGHLPARSGALWRLAEDQADQKSTED
jgi:glycosidase